MTSTRSRFRSFSAGLLVAALLAAGCSGSGNDEVSTSADATAIPTTRPIVLPDATATMVPPTAVPAASAPTALPVPTTAATAVPTQLPAPTAAPAPAPTAAPALAPTAAPAQPTAAPALPAADPASVATAVPVEPTATAVPAVVQTGGVISLGGDFPVVNLHNGAELAASSLNPRGPAVLWFWAPH